MRAPAAIAAAVGLVTTIARPALAYRPFNGTDADVAEDREIELELGPIGYEREGDIDAIVTPSYVLNLGIVPRWELVFEGKNVVTLEPDAHSDLEELALSVKHVLREGSLQNGAGPSIAAEAGWLLPSREEPAFGASLLVVASQKWSAATAHLNVEGAYDRAHRADLFTSLILEGPDRWPARPVAEAFVEREIGVRTEVSALVGGLWPLRRDVVFDFGVRLARADERLVEVRAGLTWAIPSGRPVEPAGEVRK